jgi:hypothetical protein
VCQYADATRGILRPSTPGLPPNLPDLLTHAAPARRRAESSTPGAHARSLVQDAEAAPLSVTACQRPFGRRGAKGTRTPDLLVANETRYQLRHSPAETGRADQHRDFTTSGGGGLLRFCQLLAGRRNRLGFGGRWRVGRDRHLSAR